MPTHLLTEMVLASPTPATLLRTDRREAFGRAVCHDRVNGRRGAGQAPS